jgi:formiminotetrahydrofolate cyclodeaminase
MAYEDQPIGAFLDDVASRTVTPAGGTAAAIVGAVGTALCEMVCLHTVADDDCAGVAEEMADRRADLGSRRTLLLDLAGRDADVVDALLAAPPEEAERAQKRATGVPLAVAEACLPVLEHAAALTARGTDSAVPDAGTGAVLVHSALRASVLTVRSNLERVPDQSFVDRVATRATDLERAADAELDAATAALATGG